jgi:hypothetical protein
LSESINKLSIGVSGITLEGKATEGIGSEILVEFDDSEGIDEVENSVEFNSGLIFTFDCLYISESGRSVVQANKKTNNRDTNNFNLFSFKYPIMI